jgi:hypothetical protein
MVKTGALAGSVKSAVDFRMTECFVAPGYRARDLEVHDLES